MHYVYILKSKKDKKLYIGVTSNLKRRYSEHCEGRSESTKNRRPLTLVYYEAFFSKDDAHAREANLKYFKNSYSALKKRINISIDSA